MILWLANDGRWRLETGKRIFWFHRWAWRRELARGLWVNTQTGERVSYGYSKPLLIVHPRDKEPMEKLLKEFGQ